MDRWGESQRVQDGRAWGNALATAKLLSGERTSAEEIFPSLDGNSGEEVSAHEWWLAQMEAMARVAEEKREKADDPQEERGGDELRSETESDGTPDGT